MTKYDIIFEALQEKVNSGELTVEDAEILNDEAFEKYGEDDTEYEEVTESADDEDEGVTYEQYLEAMEEELFGEATRLSKEIRKNHINVTKKIDDVDKARHETQDREYRRTLSNESDTLHDKEVDLDVIDSLTHGKKASKTKQQRTVMTAIDTEKNIREGKAKKHQQQKTFNSKPSKKSLENKRPGEVLKAKELFVTDNWYKNK